MQTRKLSHERTKNKKFNAKKAKKELDRLWSLAIRRRDVTCRKCGKAPASQAAHIFSRGNLSTRWDLRNGWGADYYCHITWSHRNPMEFAEWIEKDIGIKAFKELQRKSREIYNPSNLKADYERIKKELIKI